MPKTLIPFVQSPYQNRTDLGRFGGLDKGFYGNMCRLTEKALILFPYTETNNQIKYGWIHR